MKKSFVFKTFITFSTAGVLLGTAFLGGDAHARRGGHFPDSDGDGVVSRQEFLDRAEQKFNTRDQDGDGAITLPDVLGHAESRFTEIDSDQDGVLTHDELRSHHRARRGGPPPQQ